MCRTGYILSLLLLLNNLLFSQNYDIKRLGAANGLSQGMVTSFCQDDDGFLWTSTFCGLNRFDGTRFSNFFHESSDPFSISGNLVNGVFQDSKGRIWVGTTESLDCLDRKTGRFYHLGTAVDANGNSQDGAVPMFETPDGHIWLCNGLTVIEMVVPNDYPEKPERKKDVVFTCFNSGNGLPMIEGRLLLDILPDSTANIYYYNGERYRFEPNARIWQKIQTEATPEAIRNNEFEMIFDPKRHGHWLRQYRNLSFVQNGNVVRKYTLPEYFEKSAETPFEKPLFSSAHCDGAGNIWMLADGNLYKVNPNEREDEPLNIELVLDKKVEGHGFSKLLIDRSGILFVGTSGYGMVSIVPKNNFFAHLLEGQSMGEFSVFNKDTLLVSIGGWVSTLLPNGEIKPRWVDAKPRKPSNQVLKSSDGRIFSKFYPEGGGAFLNIVYPDGRAETQVIPIGGIEYHDPIFEDREGRIWVSSSSGELAVLPKGERVLQVVPLRDIWGNFENKFTPKQFYQSKNGVLWLATFRGLVEIHALDGQKPVFKLWKNDPNDPHSLSNNATFSVLDDPANPDRFLWVGTNGSGLFKMDKTTGVFQHFSTKDGLPNNVVYGILNDGAGRLWMSTNYGLSCFSPQKLHFRNFTTEDGLLDNEFNTHSFYKFPDGKMGFGGVRGINIFNPAEILPSNDFPPVFISGLKINNKTVDLRDSTGILPTAIEFAEKITLRHDQNFLAISYVILDFVGKNNRSVFYKMDGVDRDWVFTGTLSELTYTDLSPGKYTLRIKNTNENGEKNPKETTLIIEILPPWWGTWWAYFAYLLLFGFIVWRIFKFQAKRIKMKNDLIFKEKEAKNLQEIDEMKTRFFTNITHEFRTPLTLILEPARQIEQSVENPGLKTQASIISNNAKRLLAMVNQLLDLSKIEGGSITVNWSSGDLLPVVREVVEWFQPLVGKKQQTLVWKCDLPVLEGVSDPSVLEKIVYNLLSNAHKFTPEGGRIEIEIAKADAENWQMRITDNGIGIAPEKLPHIFDRFFQADNSLTRRNEGTGIGLALVQELCKLLKGTISVESHITEGSSGTTFLLLFPLRPANAATNMSVANSMASLPQRLPNESLPLLENTDEAGENAQTVLLVEDNDELREYLKMMLMQNGYAILEAENGKIGLEKAIENVPDLIISDVMMPEMDGYELTETLKNNAVTSHIPIVILTAKGRQESKIEGYRRGADAYISKPFSTEELLVRVGQLLEIRRKLQQKFQVPNIIVHGAAPAPLQELESQIADIDLAWITALREKIEENIGDENFIVDDLVSQFHMGRKQFYAKVKALTGLTPARMVRDMRLDKAYLLLNTQGDIRVNEVAFAIGMHDVKYFGEIFKKRFGVSPQSVRTAE